METRVVLVRRPTGDGPWEYTEMAPGYTGTSGDAHSTISLGVSALHKGETLEGLIERTDQAMYAAKVKGRNCSVVSTLEPRLVAAPASKAAV